MSAEPTVSAFMEEVLAVLEKYSDATYGILTVAETVGALEIIKDGVMRRARRDNAESDDG